MFFWPKYFSNIKQWKLSQRKKIEVHSMMQLSIQLQIFYFQWRIFVIKCCYSNCNIIYQKAEKHVFFLIQTIKNPFIEIAPVCNIWLDQRFDLYIRCGGRYSTLNIYLTCITTIAFYPEVDNLTFIVCKKMHLL